MSPNSRRATHLRSPPAVRRRIRYLPLRMILPILGLGAASFVIAWLATLAMIRIAPRFGLTDKPGGRKIHAAPKPLGGGVAIFVAIAGPMLVRLLVVNPAGDRLVQRYPQYENVYALVAGAQYQTPLSLAMLAGMLVMHAVGLIDDRKALGPYSKLIAQLLVAGTIVIGFKMRALTALGVVPSTVLTILWIVAITNAFNFLDNMDGLSAGVAAVCTTAGVVTALSIHQWFVAATLALLPGALLGFLYWNFTPAK